jgi:membrane protein implicated in regulation of membrane protease activity
MKRRAFSLMSVWFGESFVISGFFGLAYLFGDRVTGLIKSAERGFTAVVIVVLAIALAVIAFFSFRKRRIRMLDQDPEALFERREILLGPAADRIADAVALGDVNHDDENRPAGG